MLKLTHWYDYISFLSAIFVAACLVYFVRRL